MMHLASPTGDGWQVPCLEKPQRIAPGPCSHPTTSKTTLNAAKMSARRTVQYFRSYS
jgi:hypothetical protein